MVVVVVVVVVVVLVVVVVVVLAVVVVVVHARAVEAVLNEGFKMSQVSLTCNKYELGVPPTRGAAWNPTVYFCAPPRGAQALATGGHTVSNAPDLLAAWRVPIDDMSS